MKNYILINPLLVEALTDEERAELEAELKKLKKDLKNRRVPLGQIKATKAKIADLEKKLAEEPAPAEEPKQGPKQPADAEGAEETGEKVETAEEFIDRKAREFSDQYIGDLTKEPRGGELSPEERERLEDEVGTGYLNMDLYDYYFRKAIGADIGDNIAVTLASRFGDLVLGFELEDLIDVVIYGNFGKLQDLLEPNINGIMVDFFNLLATAKFGTEADDPLSPEEMKDIAYGAYAVTSTIAIVVGINQASKRVYENLVDTAKRMNLTQQQLLNIAKKQKGIPLDRALPKDMEEKIMQLADSKGYRDKGFDAGKWGTETESKIKRFAKDWVERIPQRVFFGPIASMSEILFNRVFMNKINDMALEEILGKGVKGMTVDEKIDQLGKTKQDLEKTLRNQEQRLANAEGKKAERLKKEIEDTKRSMSQVNTAVDQIRKRLDVVIKKAVTQTIPELLSLVRAGATFALEPISNGIFLNVLDDIDIIFDGSDFEVVQRLNEPSRKNLSKLFFSSDYLKKAAQAEADRAARIVSSSNSFTKAIDGLKSASKASVNRLKKVMRAVKSTLNEEQNKKGDSRSSLFDDIMKEVDKIESETLEIQADITGIMDELAGGTQKLSDNIKDAAADLIKSDLEQLQKALGGGRSVDPDTEFQTPVDESKIRISKSKLVDLISEQVKEHTQTIEVDKTQLIAFIVEEASKQINRKK